MDLAGEVTCNDQRTFLPFWSSFGSEVRIALHFSYPARRPVDYERISQFCIRLPGLLSQQWLHDVSQCTQSLHFWPLESWFHENCLNRSCQGTSPTSDTRDCETTKSHFSVLSVRMWTQLLSLTHGHLPLCPLPFTQTDFQNMGGSTALQKVSPKGTVAPVPGYQLHPIGQRLISSIPAPGPDECL